MTDHHTRLWAHRPCMLSWIGHALRSPLWSASNLAEVLLVKRPALGSRVGGLALMGIVWLLPVGTAAAGTPGQVEQPTPSALGDVAGPGQPVARPGPQCPRTIACQYAERNVLPDGYRVQSLLVCGANCTTQYWVSSRAAGQQLLELAPVRGGAILAIGPAGGSDNHPPVRVVVPSYAPADPACCPSGYADTTYTWAPESAGLVADEPILTPASEFPGWDAVRQALQAEGWVLAGV